MTRMRYMWMPTRRWWARTRVHALQPRPALDRRLEHRATAGTNELLEHAARTDAARSAVVAPRATVVAAWKQPATRDITLV